MLLRWLAIRNAWFKSSRCPSVLLSSRLTVLPRIGIQTSSALLTKTNQSSVTSRLKKTSGNVSTEKSSKVPRGVTGYQLFTKEFWSTTAAGSVRGKKGGAITVAAENWRKLTEEQRQEYNAQAALHNTKERAESSEMKEKEEEAATPERKKHNPLNIVSSKESGERKSVEPKKETTLSRKESTSAPSKTDSSVPRERKQADAAATRVPPVEKKIQDIGYELFEKEFSSIDEPGCYRGWIGGSISEAPEQWRKLTEKQRQAYKEKFMRLNTKEHAVEAQPSEMKQKEGIAATRERTNHEQSISIPRKGSGEIKLTVQRKGPTEPAKESLKIPRLEVKTPITPQRLFAMEFCSIVEKSGNSLRGKRSNSVSEASQAWLKLTEAQRQKYKEKAEKYNAEVERNRVEKQK